MGTIKQGILGGFSGKVGTVIGASWNGIQYMRSIAASVANPRTEAQLEQRARFSAVVKFLRPITSFLRLGFKSQAQKMTAFNAAMSYNLGNALKGTYPAYEIDYPKVMISQGNLAGALNPAAVSTVAGKIDFSWDDNSTEAGALAEDKAAMVVYSPLSQKAVTLSGGSTRQSGTQSVTLPDSFSGQEVQCYIAFTNANESDISDSQFVCSVVVA